MLVELGAVEQRYQAVLEVLEEGVSVTEVARRCGVARQTVHGWLRRYAEEGLGGLADRSPRPASCPHQMPARVEARIVGMRREHPGWGRRGSGSGWSGPGWCRCRAGRRFTGRWCGTAWSRCASSAGGGRITGGGSGRGRWTCGRWT